MADPELAFELVAFGPSREVDALLRKRPDDLEVLHVDGVPKSFVSAGYRSLVTLSIAVDATGHRLVKFGTTVLDGSMVLDPDTGEIFRLLGRTGTRVFVNSTLRAFTATVREVSAAFPFYSDDATDEEIKAAAAGVAETIRNIDREAVVPDRYWSTFLDDMLMGDLGTVAVLDLYQPRNNR